MEFGEKVKKLRKEKKMTQEEVAEYAGISARAYIDYEKGKAKPRYRKTYDRLAKVLGCNVDYLLKEEPSIDSQTVFTLAKAATVITGAVAVAGGGPLGALATVFPGFVYGVLSTIGDHWDEIVESNETKGKNKIEAAELFIKRYQKKKEQFTATAMGIILASLSQKGIICQTEKESTYEGNIFPEKSIKVIGNDIENWWFVFFPKMDEKYLNNNTLKSQIKSDIPNLISRFALLKPDSKKMISIVVESTEVYEQLCKYKDHNSYRGNMSIVLIDTVNVRVAKETAIASFRYNGLDKVISII